MQAFLITLGFKLGDMQMWRQFLHSKLGLTIASLALGIISTLGFSPYGFWVITLITLSFEFLLAATLHTKKQVFWSLWLYFTALNAATLSWLNFVMHGFGQMPLPLSWLLEILLSAYLAIFHGLLGCVAFKIAHRIIPFKNNTQRKTASASPNTKAHQTDEFDESSDDTFDELDEFDETFDDALSTQDVSDSSKLNAKTSNAHEVLANSVSDTDKANAAQHTADSKQAKTAAAQKAKAQGENHFYRNAFLLCFLPLALILADYLVGIVFTGFPWMYVGYIALEGPFSAFAPLLGVRGITLILFICAGALALTLERRYVYLPVAGILFAVGIFCQGLNFTQDLPAIKVTGIQGNIAQQVKWNPNQVMPTIGLYVDQTMPYFGRSELIIWPESALPVFAQEIEPILQDLNTAAYNSKTPLLTGIQHVDFEDPKKIETFNSIYLLGNSDNLDDAQIYKKRQLVPFGERVPFESLTRKLGSIFNFPMSSFTAGSAQQEQLVVHVTQTHAATDTTVTSKVIGSQSTTAPALESQHTASSNTGKFTESSQTLQAQDTPQFADSMNSNESAQVKDSTEEAEQLVNVTDSTDEATQLAERMDSNGAEQLADAATDALQSQTEFKTANSQLPQLNNSEAIVLALDDSLLEEEEISPEDYPEGELIAGNVELAPHVKHITSSKADSKTSVPTANADTVEDVTTTDTEITSDESEVMAKVADGKNENFEELSEGEQEWFNAAVPELPTAKAQPLETAMDLHFIPAICYESIFPELMTSLHDKNTNGIIMISNDSWFGNTRGPDEHLAIARMRSMEMQKPMIRITNSGHSVLIDKTGKVTYQLPQDKLAVLHGDFIPNQGMTPYVRWNNIPLYIILVLLFVIGLYLRQRIIDPIQQNLENLVRP